VPEVQEESNIATGEGSWNYINASNYINVVTRLGGRGLVNFGHWIELFLLWVIFSLIVLNPRGAEAILCNQMSIQAEQIVYSHLDERPTGN